MPVVRGPHDGRQRSVADRTSSCRLPVRRSPRTRPDVPAQDGSVIVEIVNSAAGIAALRDDWDALFELTPEASGFQSHAWIATRSARADARKHDLHLGVVKTRGRVIAIFPTQLSSRGRLSFIGADLGNYAGPVFDPTHLEQAVRAWAIRLRSERKVAVIDLRGLRGRSRFLELVRRRGIPGWGAPVVVRTNTCPEVDLTGGWTTVLERHKSKQRSTWRRKAARLGRLGSVDFVESNDPRFIAEAMPRMLELWGKRWEGQRVRAGFAANAEFHLHAAKQLAARDLALLSTL